MSILLRIIAKNAPIHSWKSFVDTGDSQTGFSVHGKNPKKTAQTIFSSLCHPAAVELIAKEYEELPAQVRMELRELCGTGNASGNVRKGVQRLNLALKGALLREKETEQVFNRRVETPYGVSYKKDRVDPAKAGAQRKYALV